MNKPNFTAMTKAELWAYVAEHRDDNEAFYAYMDKVYAEPRVKIRSMEHLAELIEAREKAQKEQAE